MKAPNFKLSSTSGKTVELNKVKSKLEKELKLAILKKATLFEKDAGKRYFDEKGKNRKGSKKDK